VQPKSEKSVIKKTTNYSEKFDIKKTDHSFEKSIIKKTDHSFEKISVIETNGPKKKYSVACEKFIVEILKTTSRYKQITKGLNKAVVKNGGQFFGVRLEGSPDPKRNTTCGYSKTFDFIIYEMYPDRQLNTARFSFDPNKKQLYEYDINNDKLKLLEFDAKLLPKYDSLCNCY